MPRPAPRDLTPEEETACLEVRKQGTHRYKVVGWSRIAKRLGLSRYAVLRRFAPHELTSFKRGNLTAHEVGAGLSSFKFEPPLPVLEERDRVYLAPRDPLAALLGDPPPGRSALDKRRLGAV